MARNFLLIRRCLANLSFQSNQTKVNNLAMGVANKKRRLRSSQQLPSLESPIEDVEELLHHCGR